jgi:hypothetical protein
MLLLKARNKLVTRELQSQYGKHTSNELRVFCVSNKSYSKHVFEEETGDKMQIAASGIPELRTFCCLLPAEAQFEAATHFLESEIPDLLGELDLWTKSGQKGNNTKTLPATILKTEEIAQTFFDEVSANNIYMAIENLTGTRWVL